MRAVKFDKENSPAYIAAAVAAFHASLSVLAKQLAQVRGTADLSWFDELHRQALNDAKGTSTEHVTIDVEAVALTFGIEVIEAIFSEIRVGLVKNSAR